MDALDSGQTIDKDHYINNGLGSAVEELIKERSISRKKGTKLLHDNAKSHVTKDVLNCLQEKGINLMPHPTDSPGLSPCNFWLFEEIKRNLTDQTDENSLFNTVSNIVLNIPEKEFKNTFDLLLERM